MPLLFDAKENVSKSSCCKKGSKLGILATECLVLLYGMFLRTDLCGNFHMCYLLGALLGMSLGKQLESIVGHVACLSEVRKKNLPRLSDVVAPLGMMCGALSPSNVPCSAVML